MSNTHRFTELLTVAPPWGFDDEFYDPADPATAPVIPFAGENPNTPFRAPECSNEEKTNADW